ncbi:MAG: hypothetical protein NC548_39080 [Lachnospiraceae bacterium]|nr:hypothetical protein [Lachnospiraceae bacterium]
MMVFEKAIENYAKNRKKFYDLKLKQDIMDFNERIERMAATGKCPAIIACDDCPMMLLPKSFKKGCGTTTRKEVMEQLAMEYEEAEE